LILDDYGNLATYAEDDYGNPIISTNNEIITIVEEFVRENPGFSFNGARGIIGLTGFDGILGYRTNSGSPNREEEIERVRPIIAKLKELGWTFASHSYAHAHMSQMTFEELKADTDQWKEEVESLVGPTRVFIHPYGDFIRHTYANMDKINYLINVGGFDIHLGVGINAYAVSLGNYVFEDRKNIDGLTFRYRRYEVSMIFDTYTVADWDARSRYNNRH